MTWAIVPATEGAARYLAPRLTRADRDECWVGAHAKPIEALMLSMYYSLESWTWIVDDAPACMFGFSAENMLGEKAAPWMLGSLRVRRHRIAFLRNYRAQIDRMLGMFPLLETWVDARHTVCLRWLAWTGFEIEPEAPFGIEGAPFHRVTIRRD